MDGGTNKNNGVLLVQTIWRCAINKTSTAYFPDKFQKENQYVLHISHGLFMGQFQKENRYILHYLFDGENKFVIQEAPFESIYC